MKKATQLMGIGLFSVLALFSCKKLDLDKLTMGEWNPNLAIPLAHSTFDVYDVLAYTDHNDLVVIDPSSGLLALIYNSDVTSIQGDQFMLSNDFSKSKNVSLTDMGGVSSPAFSSSLSHNDNEVVDFSFSNGALIKEFKFDDGNFDIAVSSSFKHPITINISIPSLKKNGAPFTTAINLAAASGSNSTTSVNENLSDYIADLTLNNTSSNKLKVNYSISVNGNGNAILPTDNLSFSFNFSSMKMNYAKGYFGTQNIDMHKDSVLLKIYQTLDEGQFELVDPKVRFFINNSFGMPINLKLNQISTININTNQVLNLLGYTQTITLNTPTVIGDSAMTTVAFDKNNTTNIQQVVTPAPKYLTFDAKAVTNPNGNLGTDNFISKKSKIEIKSEVELPLHGLAYNFKVRDTVDFTSPSESKNIRSVMFRLITNNGFPINVFAKIKFLDENHNEVFVLTDEQKLLVMSAEVDGQGKVTSSSKKITDLTLSQAQIDLLDQVKYIELFAEANTKDFQSGKNIKIYDTYKLDLKLSVQFEAKF